MLDLETKQPPTTSGPLHMTFNKQDVFAIVVFIKAGSIFEQDDQAGISHLLEHLLFRTKKNMTHEDLLKKLEWIGGQYNAATSKDVTFYHITTDRDNWEEAVRLIHTIVFDFNISQKDLDHEREICKQELYKTRVSETLFDTVMVPNMFANSVYDKSVIGTEKTLDNIKLKDLQQYYQKHYSSCHISISCNVTDKAKVRKMTETLFKKQLLGAGVHLLKHDYLSPWTKAANVHIFKYNHSSFNICYRFRPYETRTYITLEFITYMLNGGLESILTNKLREEGKSVYSCTLIPLSFFGAGFLIFSAMSSSRIEGLIQRYFDTIQQFTSKFVTKSEFKRFKKTFTLRQKLASNDVLSIVTSLGLDHYYTNVPKTWSTYNKIVNSITYDEVWALAKDVFSQPSISLVTTDQNIKSIDQLQIRKLIQDNNGYSVKKI